LVLGLEGVVGVLAGLAVEREHAQRPQRQTSAPASPATCISSHLRPGMPNL
jgi:hypothetical protein